MAKKLVKLSFTDIVLQADAETIREALAARTQIDELLIQREEAYRRIEELELQVEELVGEEGQFIYPEPPVVVAGFNKPVPASRPAPEKPAVKPAPAAKKPVQAREPAAKAEPAIIPSAAADNVDAAAPDTDPQRSDH